MSSTDQSRTRTYEQNRNPSIIVTAKEHGIGPVKREMSAVHSILTSDRNFIAERQRRLLSHDSTHIR